MTDSSEEAVEPLAAVIDAAANACATPLAAVDADRRLVWANRSFHETAERAGSSPEAWASHVISDAEAVEPAGEAKLTPLAWEDRTSGVRRSGWLIEMAITDTIPTRDVVKAIDPVTGVGSRATLDSLLAEWFARRGDRPFAVVFLDINGFKQVNDRCGHLAGDRCLRQLGDRLRAATRAGDAVGRFGGDEFVVLLDGVKDAETSRPIEERLRRCGSLSFSGGGEAGSDAIEIGVSLGIAYSAAGYESPQELIAAADRAMYDDKRSR